MLKKVLKYEWISTGRILVILHIALALVTLLGNIEEASCTSVGK